MVSSEELEKAWKKVLIYPLKKIKSPLFAEWEQNLTLKGEELGEYVMSFYRTHKEFKDIFGGSAALEFWYTLRLKRYREMRDEIQ